MKRIILDWVTAVAILVAMYRAARLLTEGGPNFLMVNAVEVVCGAFCILVIVGFGLNAFLYLRDRTMDKRDIMEPARKDHTGEFL
jgi:hypothetical protein